MTPRAAPGEPPPGGALPPPSDPWAATAPPIPAGPVPVWTPDGPTPTAPTAPAPTAWPAPTRVEPAAVPAAVPAVSAPAAPAVSPAPRAPAGRGSPSAPYRRRRRRWPWVLGPLGVLSLACCGVAATVLVPILQQHPARVATPETVAGLTKVGALDPYASELQQALASGVAVDTAFAAVYAEERIGGRELARLADRQLAEDVQAVVFLGVTVLILNPGDFLEQAIATATAQGDLGDVRDYDPGELGGQLRCGTTTDDRDVPVVICAWADHGSIGVTVNYDRDLDASADLLRRIRAETLTRL